MTDEPNRPAAAFAIWVDADACPRDVRDLIMRAAVRRGIRTVFVANSPMSLPPYPELSFTLVPSGPDEADDHLVAQSATGDIAVTGDIPLAARLIEKDVHVLNPRGETLTTANIGERLAMRNLMEELRSIGQMTGGPKEFDASDRQRFANALDRLLTMRLKQ